MADIILNNGIKTYSGSIASFELPSSVYADGITIDINPVQSGSGDPSPTNVRPISGWTGANVTRTGKNMFGGTYNEFFPLHFESDKTVIASADVVDRGTSQIAFYDENKYRIDYWGMSSSYSSVSGRIAKIFELPKESYYVRFVAAESTRYMIELGDTNTIFEPYVGDTYSITFPTEAGTVYGGTLDVTTGLLTVTMAEVDLGTLNWSYTSRDGQPCFQTFGLSGLAKGSSGTNDIAMAICSVYMPASWNNNRSHEGYDKTFAIYPNGANFSIRNSAYTDAAAFKSAMSGVQLVYELATPQTYQLSPTDVALLLGVNNVWADTGDSTVKLGFSNNMNGKLLIDNNDLVYTFKTEKTYVDKDVDLKIHLQVATMDETKAYLGIA